MKFFVGGGGGGGGPFLSQRTFQIFLLDFLLHKKNVYDYFSKTTASKKKPCLDEERDSPLDKDRDLLFVPGFGVVPFVFM